MTRKRVSISTEWDTESNKGLLQLVEAELVDFSSQIPGIQRKQWQCAAI
jgi:hypothetical protein